MASKFPVFIAHGQRDPLVAAYTVDASATFIAGALVFKASDDEIEECGADPADILGIALMPAAQSTLYGGKVLVAILDPDVIVGMSSSTVPAVTHLLDPFGIAKSTHWQVDIGDTSNTRVHVIKIDTTNGIFFVKFMAANLQADAIAS